MMASNLHDALYYKPIGRELLVFDRNDLSLEQDEQLLSNLFINVEKHHNLFIHYQSDEPLEIDIEWKNSLEEQNTWLETTVTAPATTGDVGNIFFADVKGRFVNLKVRNDGINPITSLYVSVYAL